MRAGLIAHKLGMMQKFLDNGQQVPVTLLKVDGCRVVGERTQEKDGYTAVIVGSGSAKANRLNKPQKGYFSKNNIEVSLILKEFRVDSLETLNRGTILEATHFTPGQFVDVTATTIGKGFAGGMKRHGFGGLRASHGVSITHRSHGSTGNRQDPGKVFKNKKMAGHMGSSRVTTQNLEVIEVDSQRGLVYLKGAVPGAKGGIVLIKDAIKKLKV